MKNRFANQRTRFLTTLMFFCFFPVFAVAQSVRGTVKDTNGEPIIGATIRENGTDNASITDLDGKFTLNNVKKPTITVSYIGFVTQTVNVLGKSNVEVVLEEDDHSLNEVVVVGFGSMRRSDLTGSVASANIKDFEKEPNVNIMQSLQGTVPGLNVGQVASAGATPDISIRGTNTISGNSSVLVVLDGIIYTGSISAINPADIESVDVLKDASASAIYGAQASNGVILITTKRGKDGKAKIDFSTSYTFQNPTKDLHPMNRAQLLAWDRKVSWYDAYTKESGYTQENPNFNLANVMPDAYLVNENGEIIDTDYDWWDHFTRTGSIWDTKFSVSGGTKDISYLLSLNHTSQKNFMLNDDFKRNSIRVNVEGQVRSWWKVGLQAFGSFINTDGQETYLYYMLTQSPLASPYDADGNLVDYPMHTARENPYHGSDVDDYDRTNIFFANLYTEIKLPLKGLVYRMNFGNNYRVSNHNYASKYANSNNGEAYKNHSDYYDYTLDNILTYSNTFGKHGVTATFVYGASRHKYMYTNADATNFARMTLGYNSLQLGQNQYTNSSAWKETSLYQIGRINYKYNDRYLATATIRRDGFSGFAKDHKFGTFPSVALGWVASEEPWFKVKWIDNLKVRAGYGVSGNQTSRYASLSKVRSAIGYIFGSGASGSMRQELYTLGNNDLKWERTKGLNMGLDFVLLNNRISGTIDGYVTTTKDLLYNVSIPTITGFSSIASNVGKIQNKGIELSITSRNIVTPKFEWTTTFNISHNSNEIKSLTGVDSDGDGKEDDMASSGLFIGKSLSAIYDYKIDGIYQVNDNIPDGYFPGNYRIVDTNGDGQITTDDRTVIGKADPDARMGLLNKFRYTNWTLSFFFNSIVGGHNHFLGRNTAALLQDDNALRYNMISKKADLFWSPLNTDGIYSLSHNAGKITPHRYENRSFLRLQDVTLAYDVPKTLIKKIGIEGLNVYFNAKNLFTITGWHGWDPEYNTTYTDDFGNTRQTGSDFDGRPVMRSFCFGVNVSF